ncbi:hypothetical protein SAMN05216174_10327 [Actinokineospora iranica]|uniref:Uncharacterized protein n=2 Tax=Actinokineospora iranica TaxID=1271860 RepID=A0A1G6MUW7_9PSEU|nr:hypothetical protein SAMN05216174_10327 [Actinokineospora iranica]
MVPVECAWSLQPSSAARAAQSPPVSARALGGGHHGGVVRRGRLRRGHPEEPLRGVEPMAEQGRECGVFGPEVPVPEGAAAPAVSGRRPWSGRRQETESGPGHYRGPRRGR